MEGRIHLVEKEGSVGSFSTSNPATGEPLAEYPVFSARQVGEAVARARQAQLWWSQTPLVRRGAVLRGLARLLIAERDALAKVITAESGKPLAEAVLSDVMVAADAARYCAENAAVVFAPQPIPHDNPAMRFKRGEIMFTPLGVIGIISSWNYPLSIPAPDVAAALATGNAVVVKPSELTPQTVFELERLIGAALDAEGLTAQPRPIQVVTGMGATGQALIASGIDKLIFTGSVHTGRRVALHAAERLLPVVLELGGKDAMIVLEDADVDVASSAAVWGSMMNAGQTCLSVERCYVQRKLYPAFVGMCHDKIARLKIGNGADPDTDVGPLISARQLQHVAGQVEEARAQGSNVLIGGTPLPEVGPNFYAPTLMIDVQPAARLMREETFGPVLPVVPFDRDEEALHLANDSDFGLGASVWGKTAHATAIARRVRAGSVLVNDLISGFAVSAAPHGGLKKSGIGRTHGLLGMRELVAPIFLDVDRMPRMKKLWWYPYTGTAAPMGAFAELVHAQGIGRRLSAALRSLGLFRTRRR
jgi:acyl-CoA reductase-like NAD-dependent aldehyde dehydrogenase